MWRVALGAQGQEQSRRFQGGNGSGVGKAPWVAQKLPAKLGGR